jgi:orotidine-5'-phosphate decarboxylase
MMDSMTSPIILALDTDDLDLAAAWIGATSKSVDIYKVGLEFFLKFGVAGLQTLRGIADFELFLDLKLHDIPNTVAGAVSSINNLNPKFLTVHASGGSAMIRAAATNGPNIAITAVTVLTSLNEEELANMGMGANPLELSVSLAKNAVGAGARAIVCSPLEVAQIRQAIGDQITIITPGVRPVGSELGDQNRVMTPQQALSMGANYLVIGRPITSYFEKSAQAMSERAAEILASIRS